MLLHRADKLAELHTAGSSKARRLESELTKANRHCTETLKELQQRTANNDTLQVTNGISMGSNVWDRDGSVAS